MLTLSVSLGLAAYVGPAPASAVGGRTRCASCAAAAAAWDFPDNYDPFAFGDVRLWSPAAAEEAVAQLRMGTAGAERDRAELHKTLASFRFDGEADSAAARAELAAAEALVFRIIVREAKELAGSRLTSSLVQRVVLRQSSLSAMLAALLAPKVGVQTPNSFDPTEQGGGRLEQAAHETALYETMARELGRPAVLRSVLSDLLKVMVVDPAASGLLQPALFFKGFHALVVHRVAHALWADGSAAATGAALLLQSRASELFGVDIHPAARIGNGVMLDHATGVVIGATAVVGDDVYMLHSVTLGATGKPTRGAKRHPTVGSRVVLGAGCTVLGDVAIGDDCTIGAGGIVTKRVPSGSTVVGVNKIVTREPPAAAAAAALVVAEGEAAEPAAEPIEADYTWYYNL